MSGYVKGVVSSQTEQEAYVKVITSRTPVVDNKGEVTCSYQKIAYSFKHGEFILNTETENIHLSQLYKVNSAPDLFCGVSESGMYYSLYYYLYRNRIYIQLAPIPKGFLSEPIQPEKFYIISSENLCEQPSGPSIVQQIRK
jgi:hypothetical protein